MAMTITPGPQITRWTTDGSCHLPTMSATIDLSSFTSERLNSTFRVMDKTSSMSSDPGAAFFASRSRVVRLYNLPRAPESLLSRLRSATMWACAERVWAVFGTHDEASAALTLSGRTMSVAAALESDLEPFHNLHRVLLFNSPSTSSPPSNTLPLQPPLLIQSSMSDYTLSTNPPNPKTSFRLGDWICSSPNCAAHNFGRNLACIGCGCPRSNTGNASASTMLHQVPHQQSNSRALPSPRFNSMSNNVTYYSSAPAPSQQHHFLQSLPQQQHVAAQHPNFLGFSHPQPPSPFESTSSTTSLPHDTNPPKSSHPLLTPSGRAFAIGGKVQNVSSDPLSPCIMYWPDNEPFPEQGQIRPNGLVGVAQPPILNTGNRGPISHQPGDWICQKCNYLNWRRRKVCQTCLPYAEGNGDSISAAVQAERIALLTSVLSQTQISTDLPSVNQAPRSHSLTPPQARRPFIDLSPQVLNRPVHRSQSHFSLGQQFQSATPHYTASSPIYQTSGNREREREPSPLYSTGPHAPHQRTYNTHSSSNPNHSGLNLNLSHLTTSHSHPTLHSHSENQTSAAADANVYHHSNAATSRSHNNHNHNYNFTLPSVSVHAPTPLLPSFLQDMVQSPALSPTSTTTSSADLSSIEEYDDLISPQPQRPSGSGSPLNLNSTMFSRVVGDGASVSSDGGLQLKVGGGSSPIANIWRLDGEESKTLSAFPLPSRRELVGARKASREALRV